MLIENKILKLLNKYIDTAFNAIIDLLQTNNLTEVEFNTDNIEECPYVIGAKPTFGLIDGTVKRVFLDNNIINIVYIDPDTGTEYIQPLKDLIHYDLLDMYLCIKDKLAHV